MAQNDTPKTNATTDENKKPKAIDHSQYTKIGEPAPIDHSQYTKIEKTKTQNFLADPATSLMSGLASVPDIAIGLADIVSNGRAGKAIEDNTFYKPSEASKYWNNQKSDVSKSQVQQRQDIDGIGGKLKSALSNPSTIANTVVESLPSMLTGGVIGRGISAATKISGVAGGAIGEGAVMAGQQAEQIRQQTDDRLLTNTQSGAALATGALGTLFGYAGGKIAHKYGFGDVDTLMASGRVSQRQTANEIAGEIASTPAKSIPRKVIEGAITEGFLEELPQSVSEQILQNLALNKEWNDGVADAAVMGTLAGMAMGAGAGSFGGGSKRSEITAPPVVDDEAPNAPINPNGINGIGGNELPQDSASINQQGADTTPADLSAPIEPPNAVNTNSDPSQSLGNTQPDSAQVPADQQQSEVQPEVQPEVATPNAAVANFDPTSALSMLAEAKRRKDAERNQSSQAPVAPKPSEQMGLNPDNGPMSAAAALAVDSGAAPSIDPTTGTPLLNAPESTLSDAAALASGEQQAKPTNEQYQSKLGELDQQRSQFEQAGDYDSATKIYDQMQQLSREWQTSALKTDAAPKADYKKTESDAAWTDYYNTNRNNIGDDLFTGGYEDRLALESAPEDLRLRSAHGMAKSSSGNAISDLKDLLTNGIDPSRGDGRLFTAPLSNVFANEEDRQAASVSGTSSGSAYSDGAFTLVAKNGVGDIQNMSEVDAVMVNSAVPNAVVEGLRKDFPSMKFGYANELPTLLGSNAASQQDGVGIAQTASATEQATQDKQNTASTIDTAAQAETGKPINLVRHSRAEFDWNRDKPQGTYASIVDDPTNFESPFEEEGQRFDLEYTPKNPLTVDPIDVAHARFGSRKKGVASAGVAALSKLLSKADFDAALALNKEQAIAAVNKKFPSVNTSRVHDAYEALEVWGAQEAKKAGHDVIIGRHKKLRLTPNEPDFSEAVLLTGSGKPKAAVAPVAAPATAIASLETQLVNTKNVAEKAKIRKEINALKKDNSIDRDAHAAATSTKNDLPAPTQAQIEAGNYKKGHIKVHGLDIAIENPRGSERSGTDPDGKSWSHTMSDHYGYIKRTTGADQEQIDAYVGKNPESDKVYVVDQIDQATGGFDEHKVMLGFDSQEDAIAAYQSNFDEGWKVGSVNEMSKEQFKDWLKNSDTSKPILEGQNTAQQQGAPGTSKQDAGTPQTTEVTTDLGLIHSIPSKLMDTSHKLGDVVKDLAVITTTGAEVDNKYAKDLLATIAKLNPDVQVHIVSDLNNIKDNAIRSNLAAGGFYVPEENTAYIYPKSEDWTSSALELINHELVHSVTEQSISNGLVSEENINKLNKLIGEINDYRITKHERLTENVNERLDYATTTNPIHEIIAVGIAESEVREALNDIIGTDGLQQLDAIFTEILTKQAQVNEQRKQSGNIESGQERVPRVLPDAQQDTAATVQGIPAKSTGSQDNKRSERLNQANLSTNEEESGEVTKPEAIRDFGEKIGGARKDSATNTGSKSKSTKQKDLRPTWAKRFEVTQIVASSNSDEVGRWVIDDTRKKDWKGNPKRMGASFATQQEAEEALVLVAVGQKHRVIASRNGSSGFEIWRTISDRKGVKVVDQVFTTRDEALRYMVDNAQTIIETNTTFGEIDLPRPDDTVRKGVKRRDGAAKDSDFIDVFGFRGVEFGNWNNQEERQQLLNDAYDGLLDLADVLGIPPKALSLNGDLALAFGARGQGLSSARAHYEPEKVVINLTKMNGAGSLAHEWWHAFDHYLARQDGKASGEWIVAKDGTRSFKISTNSGDNMVSYGFSRNKSGVREDVREAYNKLMQTIFRKSEQYVEDTVRADDFVGRTKEQVVAKLTAIRKDLSEQKDVKYYKRHNKPASAEQLVEFDTFAQQIMDGIALATEWRESGEKKSRSIMSGMRWTNDALEKLSQIIKAVRGRSGFTADQKGTLDSLRSAMNQYSARLKMLADAQSGDPKVRFNPTEFAMSAKELDQGRGTNYWTTPHEMIARAFQGYVEDQVAKKKGSSPFLNYAPESAAIMTPWGWKRPYPHGSERKAINQTFDNLVDALETKETPEGTALYSRKAGNQKAGLGVNAARTALVKRFGEAVIAKLERDGKLRIVDQLSNLPSDALNSILAFHGSPFKFEKFSLDHLGRGDGQQLYGHGLYFSDSKAVSDFYRKNLAKRGDSGQLYQVNINSESKDILQWEEPLSHQQEILSRLKPLKDHLTSLGVLEQYETMLGREFNDWNGGELYTVLKHAAKNGALPQDNLDLIEAVEMGRHQKAASLYLNQLGINGLKYSQGNLDGTKSTGDSNYVIFDDSAIEIVDTFYSQNSTGIEGYYHNGEVVLIASNLTADTVTPTFLHELGGHAGFQNMMQPEQYAELMRQFDRMVKQGNPIALEAQKLAMRESNAGTQQLEMLPYLLSLAANPNVKNAIHKGAIKRFIADLISKVKAWVFDKLGVNLTLTPNDMVALAERMVKQAANSNNANGDATTNNGDSDTSNPDILFSRGFADNINDLVNNLNKEGLKKAKGRVANSMQDWLDAGLALLGRRQLVDIYSSLLPQLDKYNQLASQMDADQNDAGAKADNIVRAWSKLKDEQVLAELMHDATLSQIDPAKPRVKTDNVQKYLALKNAYDKLTPEAKEIYLKARDAYKDHYNAVHGAIKERILRSELSSQKKADLMKQMDANFFGGLKGVYFPLARFGKYTVIVRDANGDVQSVSRAETKNEAVKTRNELIKLFPSSEVSEVILEAKFQSKNDSVSRGFMAELFNEVDNLGLSSKDKADFEDTLNQLYLSSLPDLSWAKHGIHRKGTPGFSQNARRAFAQNMFHGASYLSKVRYADQLADELDGMKKYADANKNDKAYKQNIAQAVIDEMNMRHENMMNPKSSSVSSALTSLGFIYFLGLSPASAIVNIMQTPLMAFPVLGAKWGFDKASVALLKASSDYVAGVDVNGKTLNISKNFTANEKLAYDKAVAAGVIDVTQAHDLAGIAQGEDSGVMWKTRPIMRAASFMFHHAERFNREVTFIASFRLATQAGTAPDLAYKQAVDATYKGHFDYSAGNRPRFMQGNAAKVLFLFKQFGQNMIYTIARETYQSFAAKTQAEKVEARRTIGSLLAMHAVAAGVLGLPLVTFLLAIVSMMGGGDDEPWDAEVALRNYFADTIGVDAANVLMKGASRATPVDISGRVGLDHLVFPSIQSGLEGARWWESILTAAAGPIGGIGTNVAKGAQEMGDGRYMEGLEQMLPVSLKSPLKSYRYATEGVQDRTGISVMDEVSAMGVTSQAFGFSPSDVRTKMEGKSAIYQDNKRLEVRRKELMAKWTRAMRKEDNAALDKAWEAIDKFNSINPDRTITPKNLTQSYRGTDNRIARAENGVYLAPSKRGSQQAGRFAFDDSGE